MFFQDSENLFIALLPHLPTLPPSIEAESPVTHDKEAQLTIEVEDRKGNGEKITGHKTTEVGIRRLWAFQYWKQSDILLLSAAYMSLTLNRLSRSNRISRPITLGYAVTR